MIFYSAALLLTNLLTTQAAPTITIDQLQNANTNLHRILHESGGILRISTKHTNDSRKDIYQEHEDGLIRNVASYRKEALTALCTCSAFEKTTSSTTEDLFTQLLKEHPEDVQQIKLPDGSIRRTLATATVGFDASDTEIEESPHPLQLPTWFQEQCGHDAYYSMENLRDAVSQVVNLFVGKLDSEKQRDHSYRQVLQSANHLEHFHVYLKDEASHGQDVPETTSEIDNGLKSGHAKQTVVAKTAAKPEAIASLDYHMDAGFFLSFVPAMLCHSLSMDDSSFYIKSHKEPLQFEEDEIVILMGAGAHYWMNSNLDNEMVDHDSFVAASHALRLPPDAHRSWYGKMHLLPSSLTTSAFDASSVKYGDVLPTFQLNSYKAHVPSAPVDGCGTIPLKSEQEDSIQLSYQAEHRHSRRRLQHVGSPANCNNETNFFCWYQCLSIPDSEHTLDYLRDGHSLYCLDPSMLSDSSVAEAAAPCKGGYTHNSDCSGSWQETDSSLSGYEFPNYAAALEEEKTASAAYPAPETGDEYCYGGTSMYMDGFNWIGSTCVIYLFPQWVLSTPGKFALACIGSILFGILLEFVLWKRRVVYTMMPGRRRLVLSVMFYGLQLTMGYLIMLVIMTYSGPLFVSIVGGMMTGHAIYNAQDSFMKSMDGAAKDSQEAGDGTSEHGRNERTSTELANSYQNLKTSSRNNSEADEEAIGSCCGLGPTNKSEKPYGATEKTKLKENIPEGATPCCQYVL